MNFKMLSVGLSAMALLAMPGSTLTSPVSVQAAAHEHILETYITKQPTCTATGTEIRKCQTCGKITDTIKLPKVAHSVKTRTVRKATTTPISKRIRSQQPVHPKAPLLLPAKNAGH